MYKIKLKNNTKTHQQKMKNKKYLNNPLGGAKLPSITQILKPQTLNFEPQTSKLSTKYIYVKWPFYMFEFSRPTFNWKELVTSFGIYRYCT